MVKPKKIIIFIIGKMGRKIRSWKSIGKQPQDGLSVAMMEYIIKQVMYIKNSVKRSQYGILEIQKISVHIIHQLNFEARTNNAPKWWFTMIWMYLSLAHKMRWTKCQIKSFSSAFHHKSIFLRNTPALPQQFLFPGDQKYGQQKVDRQQWYNHPRWGSEGQP